LTGFINENGPHRYIMTEIVKSAMVCYFRLRNSLLIRLEGASLKSAKVDHVRTERKLQLRSFRSKWLVGCGYDD